MSTSERYQDAGIRLRTTVTDPAVPDGVVELEALTVAQLHEYAAEHGIDLGGARLKAELIEVIASAPADAVTDPLGTQVS